MKLENVRIEDTAGTILVHNLADAQGHKLLSKGHLVTAEDIDKLRGTTRELYVARLEPGDVRENQAAQRIADALRTENVTLNPPNSGRINVLAATRGVLYANPTALARLNSVQGVTLATIPAYRVVNPKDLVATVKTIGLSLPERVIDTITTIGREAGIVFGVRPLRSLSVALILTGSEQARARVESRFSKPIQTRVVELGGQVTSTEYVEGTDEIAGAITRALGNGAGCIVLAGETSIMDRQDITPRGIEAAGGVIELYGAPVEPGNLLLLAYHGLVPIVGAPGCVQSRDTNIVDLILPRLFTGEHLSRADIIALAPGGLLL